MYGICLSYAKCRNTASDLLQESFIKVFSKIDTFSGNGSLEGWIRRIVSNTARDYYRKNANTIFVTFPEYEVQDEPFDDENLLEELSNEEVMTLVQKLPDGYRVIFIMNVVEGMNHKEIAEALNITEATSRSQLARGRKLLQEWLTDAALAKNNRDARIG